MRRKLNWRVLVILASMTPALFWYSYVLANQLIFHGIRQHDGYAEVDLKTLGCFPFNPALDTIDQVPRRFRDLDGKRVVLGGFMFNRNDSGSSVNGFELVYNVQICCFGTSPQVQERVYARCKKGVRVPFHSNFVTVTGILHVKVDRDRETGTPISVYTMDVEKVE